MQQSKIWPYWRVGEKLVLTYYLIAHMSFYSITHARSNSLIRVPKKTFSRCSFPDPETQHINRWNFLYAPQKPPGGGYTVHPNEMMAAHRFDRKWSRMSSRVVNVIAVTRVLVSDHSWSIQRSGWSWVSAIMSEFAEVCVRGITGHLSRKFLNWFWR